MTETYVALKVNVDNWRWAGVPFYIRVGKRLAERRHGNRRAIQERAERALQQADEPRRPERARHPHPARRRHLAAHASARCPGAAVRIEPVKMDFHYGTSFGKASPEAYERLLLDAMSGDATLFARRDEVEDAWRFIDRDRRRLAQEREPAAALRISRRLVGPEGSRRLLDGGDACEATVKRPLS